MKLALTSAIALVLTASGAMAADAPDLIVDDVAIEAATDWDGFYIGVGGTIQSSVSMAPDTVIGGFADVGYNFTADSFLLGVEAYLLAFNSSASGTGFGVGGEVRAGFLVSDPVLVYGSLGAEWANGGAVFALPGVGVEFMVTENVSIDFQYKWYQPVSGTTWNGHSFWASANWHF